MHAGFFDQLLAELSLSAHTGFARLPRRRAIPENRPDEPRTPRGPSALNRWWEPLPSEYFWLEISGRPDFGADLNAPQTDEDGNPEWSYDLLREPQDGDVVFHYDRDVRVFIGYSFVRGDAWEDEVVWGARGASARNRHVAPYSRAGWRRGLQHFTTLQSPVPLAAVRALEDQVMALAASLRAAHGRPTYFPFVPYSGQGLRTAQAYMTKLPATLVELLGLPAPARLPLLLDELRPVPAASTELGAPYRPADEEVAVSVADPMPRDPALIERGLRGHRQTQNALAGALIAAGLAPLRPGGGPDWDIAWRRDSTLYVGEVKTINDMNEERQLRLGLGQVLRYQQRCAHVEDSVVAVLVVDRPPRDESWAELCQSLGVLLVSPSTWPAVLDL
jgi:hypothetical protein